MTRDKNLFDENLKDEWIRVIDNLDLAERKYVLKIDGIIYEADNEQDIAARLIKDYIETDDPNVQLLFRIDFARALAMYSLCNGLNVEIAKGNEKIKENYAADESDEDYDKDYDEPDYIIDVDTEITLFKAINELEYAEIYRKKNNAYEKIN